MRKTRARGKWLIDLMLFERGSYSLHIFSLVIIKELDYWLKTPDFKVPMPPKPMPLKGREEDERKC